MTTLEDVLEANEQRGGCVSDEALTVFFNFQPQYWQTQDADDCVRDCEDAYTGYDCGAVAYVEEFLNETGFFDDVPDEVARYFDYEAYARDLQLGGDIWVEDGFVFRSN
jgi:antirestriction protein